MPAETKRQIDFAVVLVRMGTPDGEYGLHSGIGRLNIGGLIYEGAGALLSWGEVENVVGIQSTEFIVRLSSATPELRRYAYNADMRDRPVRLSLLRRAGQLETVSRLKQGKVSNVTVEAESVTMTCYTAMTDLTRLRGVATRYSPAHQRQYVDEGDACCDGLSEESQTELIWP